MSHDRHAAHPDTAADTSEPEPIPLNPPRNYLWPLGLSLIVAGLVIYFLLISGELLSPPTAPPEKSGQLTLTVTATAEPSAVVLSSPTPRPTAGLASSPSPTLPSSTLIPTASAIDTATLPAPPLVSVQLANTCFAVETAWQSDPDWRYDPDPRKASWLLDTKTPYVLGIPYSAANAALFASFQPGQTITAQTAANQTLRFNVSGVARVNPSELGAVTTPQLGIVLYLLNDPAPDRAMVRATFVEATGGLDEKTSQRIRFSGAAEKTDWVCRRGGLHSPA